MAPYVRKSERGSWTQEDLDKAVQFVRDGEGYREAQRTYGIPERTLRRRISSNKYTKGSLGPSSLLGEAEEQMLVRHILELQRAGFAPSRDSVRTMAYKLAATLNLTSRNGKAFNHETEKAGYVWLNGFLRRNPDVAVRKPQGLSHARATGMNKQEVAAYFDLLEETLEKYALFDKPGNIYNMDETGLQLNNQPGAVLAEKGSRNVHVITSSEKGETVTLVACCNGEGNFLPPYLIFKGKNEKNEWRTGMPPGTKINMNVQSSYINTELFQNWLTEHFLPRKPAGRVLLILDGHASHMNDPGMLDFVEENEITIICLPSHTTAWLQPLDRNFFKPLKTYFQSAANSFMRQTPYGRINRLSLGPLLDKAWKQSAIIETGTNGFRACGIIPMDRSAIPDYGFLGDISTTLDPAPTTATLEQENPDSPDELISPAVDTSPVIPDSTNSSALIDSAVPGTSQLTPTKVLKQISPIPKLGQQKKLINRKKQSAEILTFETFHKFVKKKKEAQNKKVVKRANPVKMRKILQVPSSDSSDADDPAPFVSDESDIESFSDLEPTDPLPQNIESVEVNEFFCYKI